MSLKAKIEAVIYAAEEPVTLAQLASVFASELRGEASETRDPLEEDLTEDRPSVESLVEQGFIEATDYLTPDNDVSEMAFLTGLEESRRHPAAPDGVTAEARRAARRQERSDRERLKKIVDALIDDYAGGDRGMEIREVAGGYRIATKPEYHDAVRAFVKSLKPAMKLSLQALETLAVIAYKQPITAPEIGEIRGVDSGGVLGSLAARKLITTAGRKPVVGRPILYKTTREFLLRFGLKDLSELPSMEEFEKLAGDLEIEEEAAGMTDATPLPFEASEASDESTTEAEPTIEEMGTPSLTTASASARVGLAGHPDADSQNQAAQTEDHDG